MTERKEELLLDIYMTGIDYQKAGIESREYFSFTKSSAMQAVQNALSLSGAEGCVLLSTCNRTELWLSGSPSLSPYLTLCRFKDIPPQRWGSLFVHRCGIQAVQHLFELSCGLKSQIFGEDQIISQVKQSLFLSRETGCAGTVLEKLFQFAITASKRVKSEVFCSSVRPSAAAGAVSLLREKKGSLAGLRCLIIGSGEVGKQAARLLLREGCAVSITQRQLHSQPAEMPAGCRVIPYSERYQELSCSPVVVSATLSPHYTLRKVETLPFLRQPSYIFLDLAVPRDIDPELAQLPNVTCYNIDHLVSSAWKQQQNRQRIQALSILQPYEEEFIRWYAFRPYLPLVNSVGKEISKDLLNRLQPSLSHTSLSDTQRHDLRSAIEYAAQKAVDKRLFSLRNSLDPSHWPACFSALQGRPSQNLPLFSRPIEECKEPVFPLFLSLRGKNVLLFGGGTVSLRRVQTLLSFSCHIIVVSPKLCPELKNIVQIGRVHWISRPYREGDCENASLVTACTDSRLVNHQIAEECYRKNIPVSVADRKEECTFFFPAVIQEKGIVLGLSSQGKNHRLVSRVAKQIRSFKSSIFSSEKEVADEKNY